MRFIRSTTLVVATLALAGVLAATAAARSSQQGTIVDVAAGNKQFSTLVSLVQTAGLAGALSGSDKLTVFAPTNSAFSVLEKRVPGITAALTDPKNKGLLRQVLLYHVLSGQVKSGAAIQVAQSDAPVPTLLGKNANGQLRLLVPINKLRVRDSANFNLAVVVNPDVTASNGVIHVVNKVFVPKSVATALQNAGLIG